MKIKLLLCLFLLCLAGKAVAQSSHEYSLFMDAAGNQAILFRGHQALSYANVRFNGHYYWETTMFRNGCVMLDGRRYDDILLNIDACDDQLLACDVQGSPAVILNRDDVEWFDIDGVHFVNLLREGKYENAEEGFYAVMKEGGDPIFLKVDKNLRSSTDNLNGVDGIGYDDPNYRTDVLASFVILRKYYVVKAGKLKRIGQKKAVKLING